jgi:hypothetical protein
MGRYLHITGKDFVTADEGDYLLEWEDGDNGTRKLGRLTEVDATTMGYLAAKLEGALSCRLVWHEPT